MELHEFKNQLAGIFDRIRSDENLATENSDLRGECRELLGKLSEARTYRDGLTRSLENRNAKIKELRDEIRSQRSEIEKLCEENRKNLDEYVTCHEELHEENERLRDLFVDMATGKRRYFENKAAAQLLEASFDCVVRCVTSHIDGDGVIYFQKVPEGYPASSGPMREHCTCGDNENGSQWLNDTTG